MALWIKAALAVNGPARGGAIRSLETTVLLTVEDTLAALKKAAGIRYRPPGG